MGIYQDLKAAGVPMDSHESDLYAKVTKDSQRILQAWKFRSSVKIFENQIDGTAWYDIPFAFAPWWEKRQQLDASADK